MADLVTLLHAVVGFAACVIAGTAVGATEVLPDPTRPPAHLTAPRAAPETAKSPRAEFVLQSVLVAPGRKVAVISGLPMTLGSRIQDHTLVAVTATGATLDGPGGRIDLELFGDLPGTRAKPPAGRMPQRSNGVAPP